MKIDKVDKSKKKSIFERDISGFVDKATYVLRRIVFLIPAIPCLILFVITAVPDYPDEDELVLENCTFIRYEYDYNDPLRGSDYEEYHIYVEEYDDYLIISDIDFDCTDVTVLSGLCSGDVITLSYDNSLGTRFLRTISYDGKPILSYSDYLAGHNENDSDLSLICFVLFLLGVLLWLSLSFVDVRYKKLKGKSLFWPDENEPASSKKQSRKRKNKYN